MIRYNEKLNILHDVNGTFFDISNNLLDFTRGDESVSYVSATDSIYVGFHKPINSFYAELSAIADDSADMDLSFYNGTDFVEVEGMFDDTNSFKRSGFIRWDRSQTDQVESEVNSMSRFWYRIKLSTDINMTLRGLNIVFSDDQDLKKEFFEIQDHLPDGEVSHIMTHVAARDEIVQRLNNSGRYKTIGEEKKDIASFDLLDISQVKLASVKLSLSKIFFSISDDPEGNYRSKSEKYKSESDMIINSMYISIDTDDDGVEDSSERVKLNYGFIKRL